MDDVDDFKFKVQILARCIGSTLGLGRPIRVRIHYSKPNLQSTTESKKS